jgi:hypothetical protein
MLSLFVSGVGIPNAQWISEQTFAVLMFSLVLVMFKYWREDTKATREREDRIREADNRLAANLAVVIKENTVAQVNISRSLELMADMVQSAYDKRQDCPMDHDESCRLNEARRGRQKESR